MFRKKISLNSRRLSGISGGISQRLFADLVFIKVYEFTKNRHDRQSSEHGLSIGKYSDPLLQSMPMVSKTKDAL
jgi:hypothetical protein